MSAASGLKVFCWCWLSCPKSDRTLYRLVRKHKPHKIMLLGLGDAVRPQRMISLAQRYHPAEQIHFAGIDPFDARPAAAPPLSLKAAHQFLRPTGSKIHLFPGSPHEALERAANTLHGIELALISTDQNAESLARAWFSLNRLLTPQAFVLREEMCDDQPRLTPLSRAEIDRLAATAAPRRRAA
ncbi:MAG TPA: hypothetical protein VMJ32_13000 [Pirellulales bacterium]|nr:hypothetical protein [Pirellulales bacterium]